MAMRMRNDRGVVDNGGMALIVHTATRADAFIAPLVAHVSGGSSNPLHPEIIGIPTKGMERWLSQELSLRLGSREGRSDGICASIDFMFLGAVMSRVAAGVIPDPRTDPWRPSHAVWPLIDIVDTHRGESWMHRLDGYLDRQLQDASSEDEEVPTRRFSIVRGIADLFDRYAMHRPEMVARWFRGDDVDSLGGTLDAQYVWQPHLWRELRARIGVPTLAEDLEAHCMRLREIPVGEPAVARCAIVGVSRLPVTYLRLLDAVAERSVVELFVLHPSPALWRDIATSIPTASPISRRRSDDDPLADARHPLLMSWARDVRETQLMLGGDATPVVPTSRLGSTLLARLQDDIAANRQPTQSADAAARDQRPAHDIDDRSVQVHACHGALRQVEVLRDALMHLVTTHPDLAPSDIVIITPDLDTFAPLIEGVFGSHLAMGRDDIDAFADALTGLRVRVSDRSQRTELSLPSVAEQLLALAGARCTVAEVMEFARHEAVSRRFGFDDELLTDMEQWVRDAGVRWGIDARARAPYGVVEFDAYTWDHGLDRIMVGAAMGDDIDHEIASVAGIDGIALGGLDRIGLVAQFVDRLSTHLAALRAPATVQEWLSRLSAAVDALSCSAVDAVDERVALAQLFDEIRADADGALVLLSRQEIHDLLSRHLDGAPSRTAFRTGNLTVTSMVPMRGVPHKVVCLLGLDDGIFPPVDRADGDDLMRSQPLVGDRDVRSEALGALLDAVMCAGTHLIVTYTGTSPVTNAPIPPVVPIGELLDACAQTVATSHPFGDSLPAREALKESVWMTHPLHSFDARNFLPGHVARDRIWGVDPIAYAEAIAAQHVVDVARPFLGTPLAPIDAEVIQLNELIAFIRRPVEHFLKNRLHIEAWNPSEAPSDDIPLSLDTLEAWGIGERVLIACRGGGRREDALRSERVHGALPPGAFTELLLKKINLNVTKILDATTGACAGYAAATIPIEIQLDDGRRIVGSVPDVHGSRYVLSTYSKFSAVQRAQAWIHLIALTVANPTQAWDARIVARPESEKKSAHGCVIGAVDLDLARQVLDEIVALFDDGMGAPVMFFPRTSYDYVAADDGTAHAGYRAAEASWNPYSGGRSGRSDAQEAAHEMIFGRVLLFDELMKRHGDEFRTRAQTFWAPFQSAVIAGG